MHAGMYACRQAYIHTYLHACIRAYMRAYMRAYARLRARSQDPHQAGGAVAEPVGPEVEMRQRPAGADCRGPRLPAGGAGASLCEAGRRDAARAAGEDAGKGGVARRAEGVVLEGELGEGGVDGEGSGEGDGVGGSEAAAGHHDGVGAGGLEEDVGAGLDGGGAAREEVGGVAGFIEEGCLCGIGDDLMRPVDSLDEADHRVLSGAVGKQQDEHIEKRQVNRLCEQSIEVKYLSASRRSTLSVSISSGTRSISWPDASDSPFSASADSSSDPSLRFASSSANESTPA
jgi:hypothetical protein